MSVNRYLLGAQVLAGKYVPAESLVPPSDARLLEAAAADVVQQMSSVPNAEGGRTVDGGGVPGSFAPPAAPPKPRYFQSEIEDASDEAWTEWVRAMKCADQTTVADNGSLGMFALKPRRLADLGLMTNVHKAIGKNKVACWLGDWVAPMTQDEFLGSPSNQYRVLVASTRLYADAIAEGQIQWTGVQDDPDDDELTLSGALAILHKCGPSGLAGWSSLEDRKPSTIALVERTNGLF